MQENRLFTPLTLPNGAIISNRICKAAMEENMAEFAQLPGQQLYTLYDKWANGGAGLLLTGNVMVAPNALTGAGGVVLENDNNIGRFKKWAKQGTQNNTQLWMQISHPGRQLYANLGEQAFSPSDVALDLGKFSKMFAQPKALTVDEIEVIIQRFATTAMLAESSGFTGVQIHSAHGYLLSQFLSPLVNRRDDEWGGSLDNRARLLFEVVKRVRESVSSEFCVSVKLNSADFQKGGFDADDAMWVVAQLNTMAVDLIELSGGSYESPAMQGNGADDTSTSRREAYFIDFAREVAAIARMPVMVTGGIKRKKVAEDALTVDGELPAVDMIGIATALAYEPDLPKQWQADQGVDVKVPRIEWKNRTMAALANMSVIKSQLHALSTGKSVSYRTSPIIAIIKDRIKVTRQAKRYRRWRAQA
jgi:2,4-dienoyl-CoA reductase-like NADH-dependent reductase (Old Yellow Enzyme family)